MTVFEKNSRIGGLLRYGIPDFKLDKRLIDWRMAQMRAEGVEFQTGTFIGKDARAKTSPTMRRKPSARRTAEKIRCGDPVRRLRTSARLAGPGTRIAGRAFRAGIPGPAEQGNGGRTARIRSTPPGKHVVVIGGGDTGSDCVGTSNRHGAHRSHSSK